MTRPQHQIATNVDDLLNDKTVAYDYPIEKSKQEFYSAGSTILRLRAAADKNHQPVGQPMKSQRDLWQEPCPIISMNQVPHYYPVEAFPPLARDAIQAIAHHVQTPLALAGQCVLGAMSYLAQSHVNAPDLHKPEGMPCSLFILTAAESGSRKSASQNLSDKVIKERENQNMSVYTDSMKAFKDTLNGKMNKKDRLEYAESNSPPISPKTIFCEATLEPVVSAFIDGMRNAALSTDEAAQFFGGYTMMGDTVTAALGTFTKLWSDGYLERTRSRSNADASGVANDCRLTLSLLGQPEVLKKSLNDPILRNQGFLPRFLFAAPESIAGTRLLTLERMNDRTWSDPRLQKYWIRCNVLLGDSSDFPKTITEQCSKRKVINLSDEAAKIWLDFYNETEKEQKRLGNYEYLKPFAARAGENARRIATIFAYFDNRELIDAEVMSWAIQIVAYSLNEWVRYANISDMDYKTIAAQRLDDWLLNRCKKEGLSQLMKRDVMKSVTPHYVRKKEIFHAALSELSELSRLKYDDKLITLNPELLIY